MKVAIFTDTYIPQVNGVSQTLKRLVSYLEREKIEYRLFAPQTKDNAFHSELVYRFNSVPLFVYPECRLALPNMSVIRRNIEHFKPDLIHIATPFNIGLAGLYLGKKLNIPIVGSYHTHFDRYLQYYKLPLVSKLLWRYLHWFHHSFRTTFVPSDDARKELIRHGFSNVKIWSRGVDCDSFHPYFQEGWLKQKYSIKVPYILTYVGRLAPEKDLNTLIKIAKELPDDVSKKVHWLIVGDGPLRKSLEKDAPTNMTFTGYQKGRMLTQIYSSSSLFIFPSTTETFGNVVLESMACGTPVIASEAGGVQEIVENGKTGLLCTPCQVEEFIHSISKLLNDEKLLTKMSKSARTYALSRSWESIFSQLLIDYEEVLTDRLVSYA
ncbi:glycosyltransferase family 4 protein [Halobacillus mangrovi]|uniref:glycosyltransferase family 4 protein n=1 Tax=Halobacillus mangrovi TaxID=402384 RepID=UPI003D984058